MKKQICMLAYTLYSCDSRVRREAEILSAYTNYEIILIVPKEKSTNRSYRLNGVNIKELKIAKYQGKSKLTYLISYVYFMILSFFICCKLFLLKKIDVIHVHNLPNFLVFAAILPRLFGKKIILDIHDTLPETFSSKFTIGNKILYKLICMEEAISCRMANKIICVNHIQQQELIKRAIPYQKMKLCMNLPDPKIFNLPQKRIITNILKNRLKLVYHGTLAKRLGVDIAIQAVALLIDEISFIEFHVFGIGDEEKELYELAKKLKLQQNIHFSKGSLPVDELPKLLIGMDIGIVTNRKNAATELMLPVKMLEYIALDIPVIAPRLRTIQYYFTDKMVTYFEPENIISLTKAIKRLYVDKNKRMKQIKSARKFFNSYGWDKLKSEFIHIYRTLE